ncbi:hypothetical protein VTJ04DRAFT_5755 [Mycothermus thermophilus]|uniref:uncharacterized protein n=1 Tax=Humicola insolens TaxID=85995 RepID=UPI0037448368
MENIAESVAKSVFQDLFAGGVSASKVTGWITILLAKYHHHLAHHNPCAEASQMIRALEALESKVRDVERGSGKKQDTSDEGTSPVGHKDGVPTASPLVTPPKSPSPSPENNSGPLKRKRGGDDDHDNDEPAAETTPCCCPATKKPKLVMFRRPVVVVEDSDDEEESTDEDM